MLQNFTSAHKRGFEQIEKFGKIRIQNATEYL